MADFSVNATQLSGSSGAGSQPVQPVQETVVGFGIPKVVGDVVDIFAKGLELNRKEEAERAKQGIIGAFVREQTVINDAVATGQMSPSEAAARQRSIGNKYLASYPAYATDFKSANDSLKGITEKGEIESQVETERKRREQLISTAQTQGYIIPPDANEATVNTILNASQQSIRTRQAWEDQIKQNAEKRAQGTFDAQQAEREAKELGFRLITDLASTNISALSSLGTSLADGVRSGKITPESAQAQNAAQYAQMQAVVTAASQNNPELASAYRGILGQLNDVNQKLLDPKSNVQQLEDQKKMLITQAQVMALQNDPKLLALTATSQLLPNSLPLQADRAAVQAVTWLTGTLPTSGIMVPQVVGNASIEGQSYKMLNQGITNLNNGTIKPEGREKATQEATNGVDNIMKQTDFLAKTGQANASSLKEAAKFLAGPQMASMIQKGTLNPQLQMAAKRAFQQNYEPTVVNAITQRLDQIAPGATDTKILDAVTVTFNGTGVVFEPKGRQTGRLGIPTTDMRTNAQIAQSMKSSQDALNQLIHLGAHMEGTTDYQKYWEDNKHFFLPKVFPDPAMLKPGQVKNGYRYDGGPPGSQSSWSKVQ